jgi:dihydroorotate dehydrogenase
LFKIGQHLPRSFYLILIAAAGPGQMLSRVAVAAAAHPGAVAGVELNLACPNIPGKPTVALDFEQMADVVAQVVAHAGFKASGLPLGAHRLSIELYPA